MVPKKIHIGLDLKQANRNNIYRLIWRKKRISKQSIMQELNLSLPTVTQNLNQMAAEGLIRKNGAFGNTGGRSAAGYSIVPSVRSAVGVDINKTHIAVVVTDLNGDILLSVHDHRHFSDTPAYYKRVGKHVADLLEKAQIEAGALLGVGISMQGLVSPDHTQVIFDPILNTTGVKVAHVSRYIPHPCLLFHDAASAAFAELWVASELQDAVYLSLSTNLGGALIIGRKLYGGDHYMAGKLEHMTLVPGGDLCYCGRRGCAEVYCRASNLSALAPDNKLESFFALLQSNNKTAVQKWDLYLDNLAVLINNLHMFMDTNVILGGYMAAYLEPYWARLKQKTYERNSVDTSQDYVRLAQSRNEAIATGAALYYIDRFIHSV